MTHPAIKRTKQRIYFIDYLRGLMVLLVVLDHSMHAYSQHYAQAWFFADLERSQFIDILHLHNDAIMMPFLFFLAGIFVLPSLQRRGYVSFLHERFLRLVIPFWLGVFLISPFMDYYKKVIRSDLGQGFFDFWYHSYIRWQDFPFENLSQTGFWFLYLLAVFTVVLLIIKALIPTMIDAIGHCIRWCVRRPVLGFIAISLVLAIILGMSDLKWGAPWWIGYKPAFYVRGSRFIAKILFFILGVGVGQSGLLHDHIFLNKLAQHWKIWAAIALATLTAYVTYTLQYFDNGAYSDLPHHFWYFKDQFTANQYMEAKQRVIDVLPGVLTRTTLLGLVMLSLTIGYLAAFKRFFDKPIAGWQSLAVCSFGIYIFHEPFVIFLHYKMYGVDIDPIIKFLITGSISLSVTWLLVAKVLIKIPGLRRIL